MKLSCRAPKNGRLCGASIGDSDMPVELVAVVKQRTRRKWDKETKLAIRCQGCGWTNVFRYVRKYTATPT